MSNIFTPEQQAEIHKKLQKFIQDPDWAYVEDLITSYLADAVHISTVPITLTNDQIATEVRGRQLLFQKFSQFLNETGMIKQDKTDKILRTSSFITKK